MKRICALLISMMLLVTTMSVAFFAKADVTPIIIFGDSEISEITITDAFVTPIAGDAVEDHWTYTLPTNCHFTESTHYWYCEDPVATLYGEETFVEGRQYDVLWTFKADEGYTFADTVTVTVNGSTVAIDATLTKRDAKNVTLFSVWTKPVTASVPTTTTTTGSSTVATTTTEVATSTTATKTTVTATETTATSGKVTETTATSGKVTETTATSGKVTETTATSGKVTETTATSGKATETTATSGKVTETTATSGKVTETTATSSKVTETTATSGTAAEPVYRGDANGDSDVNMKDVLILRKFLAGLTSSLNLKNADVNGDGDVNMKDVLYLRKLLAGLIDGMRPAG